MLARARRARTEAARGSSRRSRPAGCGGSSRRCCSPAAGRRPTPSAMRRGSRAHAVLERRCGGCGSATGSARADARPRSPARAARRWTRRSARDRASRATRGAAGAPDARGRPQRYLRHEAESRRRAGARRSSSGASGARATSTAPLALGELAITRPGRPRRRRPRRRGDRARLQGRERVPPGARWAEDGALQVALYMLAVARAARARAGRRRSTRRVGARDPRPRGHGARRRAGRATSTDDVLRAEEFDAALDGGARDARATRGARLRAGEIRAVPRLVLAARAAARTRRSAGAGG